MLLLEWMINTMETTYKAWSHKSGLIYIECLVCGVMHYPGEQRENTCDNCKKIMQKDVDTEKSTPDNKVYLNNILEMENQKHLDEVDQTKHKGVHVECNHPALLIGMEGAPNAAIRRPVR